MTNPIVTVYKTAFKVDEPYHRSLEKMLGEFMVDKHDIEALRTLPYDQKQEAKKKLPVVCFNGKFQHRSNSGLIESSGLMVLDFDDKDIKDHLSLENKLAHDQYIYSYFISTGGNGFKALVRIPQVKNDAEYKQYYYSFMERYPQLDTSGKDISRCCFYTYDPNLAINEQAKIWTKKHTKENPVKLNRAKHTYNDYKAFNKVLNIIRYAEVGERNNKILNASILAGGYIANGSISYDEALRLLEQEAAICAPEEITQNEKTILNGIKYGLEKPLKEIEKLEKQEDVQAKYGKLYYTQHDVRDEVRELYESGLQQGEVTNLGKLDEHYTVKLGATTYVYGAPFSGKTQFWFEILIRLSELKGWKHVIFSPETGSAAEIYAELMSMVARKDFYKDYGNQMNQHDYNKAQDFVDKHFVVIDAQDVMIEPHEFYDVVDVIERVYSVKVHTVTADPFNEFKIDLSKYNNRQDMYLEAMLTLVRQNAKAHDRHNCIITHVQDQQVQFVDNDKKKPYYPLATYRQISGGQAWSRKGMAMISVWRPHPDLLDENGLPVRENESWIAIQKSKPKGIGKNGIVKLIYDAKEHRYKGK